MPYNLFFPICDCILWKTRKARAPSIFEKGEAKKYNYVNLSGSEKAAFDLLLDFIVRRE